MASRIAEPTSHEVAAYARSADGARSMREGTNSGCIMNFLRKYGKIPYFLFFFLSFFAKIDWIVLSSGGTLPNPGWAVQEKEKRMISNQILQDTIEGIRTITKVDLVVMDVEGRTLAKTLDGSVDGYEDAVAAFADSPAESQAMLGCQFFKVNDDKQLEYVIMAKGENDTTYMVGKMAAFQIQNLLVAYKERFDKDNFIKNLLLDNLLLVDIYNRSKKLHIDTDVKRVVFIIETKTEKDNNALETVRNLFASKTKDFITAVDEKNIILVKEVKANETYDELFRIAKVIVDMLNTEAMSSVHVAFGTIVNEIKEVSRSYKEAKMALDVGKIFYSDKNIIAYNNLGIGRLIYQLPIPLCRMFIKEIFDGKSPDEFDDETLVTINKFFENSLNVSETSRQLYIHRNTLVYRLDKIQKATGLDLRVFEDAITFKIALMVVKYMKYMETLEF